MKKLKYKFLKFLNYICFYLEARVVTNKHFEHLVRGFDLTSNGLLNYVDLEFFLYEVKGMSYLITEFEKWQKEFNK